MAAGEPTIISASRRTDIPAFYMPWLINRLRAGSASYPNPFGGQICTVSLRPNDVHSFVFWSKHYGTFLNYLDDLSEYRFICHYTITGAPRLLEPHVPDWQQEVRTLRALSERTSPRHVQWRFDPILFTPNINAAFYLDRFRALTAALDGATTRCYFSFTSFYGKVERRVREIGAYDPPLEDKLALVEAMADSAGEHGITLYACCQDFLVNGRVQKAHCIDADLLEELFPDQALSAPHKPTREMCGCAASRDIGMYDTCAYGCVYCYANQSHDHAVQRLRAHDPNAEMLVAPQGVKQA